MADAALLSALNGLQEAVFVLDEQRRIVFGNTVAEAAFGEIVAGADLVRTIRHPDCLELFDLALRGVETRGRTISIEYPVKNSFNVQATRLSGYSDDRVLMSFLDISEQQLTGQMRSDFVANVSHELRSPLTALSGFIETLQGPAKDDRPAQERFLKLMERETGRMARLVSDLLSLSKLEASKRHPIVKQCDVAGIANRVTTMLNEIAAREGKTIKRVSERPEFWVDGNEDALTQVFQNLIENAIKYSKPDSTITVSLSEVPDVTGVDGSAIAISVQDRGEGISREHLSRLTERFYRVDTDRSREKGGTGLGLAIVKHIVSQHRGRLKIDSEIGVGSTFTVFLPLTG